MEALKQLLNSTLNLSQKAMWIEIMRKPQTKRFIIDLIQKEQLRKKGVDEDGDVIGTYSEFTESINPRKVAGSHYTLEDTGEFFKSFFIKVGTNYIEIDANALKIDEVTGEQTNLFYKYGDGIIGLTEESKTKLANKIVIDASVIVKNILLRPR